MAGDIQLTCSDCGQDFTFTAADQSFYQERGYSNPKRWQELPSGKEERSGRRIRLPFGSVSGNTCDLFWLRQPTTVPLSPGVTAQSFAAIAMWRERAAEEEAVDAAVLVPLPVTGLPLKRA